MEVVWQVEVDEWCQRVLAKHWPDVPKYGDIRELAGDELEAVDLICGGFPCQPVSVAGQRRGTEDPRWLWPEMARLVRILRPRYVLVENVPGLFHQGFGDVLGDLAESGYDAEWDCISAAALGAPHLRKRIFIVAHTTGTRRDGGAGQEQSVQRPPLLSPRFSRCGEVADADSAARRPAGGTSQTIFQPEAEQRLGRRSGGDTPRVPDSDSHPQDGTSIARQECGHWSVEPNVGRVAHGIPSGVDRLRGLGNAVVPQVAEWIGRRIMMAEAS